jgi:type VI secretion system VasD/TssJ family lipoprotein
VPIHPQAAKHLGAAALVAAGLLTFALPSCSKVGLGGGAPKVTLTAARDCNSCGRDGGYPLTFRVLQVTDPSVLTGMTLTQLWDKEEKLLGGALLDRREGVVDPGRSITIPLEKKPGATAVIVVGNFCQSREQCWFFSQPLARGGRVKLVAGADCLSVAP